MTATPRTDPQERIDPERDRRRQIALDREEGWDEDGCPEEIRVCATCQMLMKPEDPGRRLGGDEIECSHHQENDGRFGACDDDS